MRRFEQLAPVLHERLRFAVDKISYSQSDVFKRTGDAWLDEQRVIAEFKSNEDGGQGTASTETSETLNWILDAEGRDRYLVFCGMSGQRHFVSRELRQWVQLVSIADCVEELCNSFFSGCKSLLHVAFGNSSSLKRIGKWAFSESGVREIHIPDTVEELCDECFYWCDRLSRVTFGDSSSLKRIGREVFSGSGLKEIHIPDSVEEICKECFFECESLFRVTFGECSSLKRIGKRAFACSGLDWFSVPPSCFCRRFFVF